MTQNCKFRKAMCNTCSKIGHISKIYKFKKVNFTMQKVQEPSSNSTEDINKKLQDFCLCVFGDDYIKWKVAIMNRYKTPVETEFIVDSGSPHSLISKSTVEKLGLEIRKTKQKNSVNHRSFI